MSCTTLITEVNGSFVGMIIERVKNAMKTMAKGRAIQSTQGFRLGNPPNGRF